MIRLHRQPTVYSGVCEKPTTTISTFCVILTSEKPPQKKKKKKPIWRRNQNTQMSPAFGCIIHLLIDLGKILTNLKKKIFFFFGEYRWASKFKSPFLWSYPTFDKFVNYTIQVVDIGSLSDRLLVYHLILWMRPDEVRCSRKIYAHLDVISSCTIFERIRNGLWSISTY